MARKEDVTLFLKDEQKMTEKLVDYLIWFYQSNGEAIIIDQHNHTFGRLDKENAELVEEVVLKNTNVVYHQITK